MDSAIWLEVNIKGGRNIHCGHLYREFLLANQPCDISGSPVEQKNRWRRITQSWEQCGDLGDTLVMGDLNVHFDKQNSETGLQK